MLALVSLTGFVLVVVVAGHVVMDLINARRDHQFYEELVRVRADARDAE